MTDFKRITDEEWMEFFSNIIKEKLAAVGMTQRELAEKADITETSLSRYLNKARIPNILVIAKIADALNCQINEITMPYTIVNVNDIKHGDLKYTELTKEEQEQALADLVTDLSNDFIDISGSGCAGEDKEFAMLINIVKDYIVRCATEDKIDMDKIRMRFIESELEEFPNADRAVLFFIAAIIFYKQCTDKQLIRRIEALRDIFSNGYCWHFAHLLQTTFGNKGKVCFTGPNYAIGARHFVWVYNGIPYDIKGVSRLALQDDVELIEEDLIPEEVLYRFKHIPNVF